MASFTKEAIKSSFLKLLNERPLSRITVRDIVEDCGINRMTFYYHFEDIPSLLHEITTENTERIIRRYPTAETFDACMDAIIGFALQNRRAVLNTFHSANREQLEHQLMQECEFAVRTYIQTVFGEVPLTEAELEAVVRFYKYECFGQIIDWIDHGMKDDIRGSLRTLSELKRRMEGKVTEAAQEPLELLLG